MATPFAIPSQGPEDWRRVLGDPDRHWRAGFSARSVAYCWELAGGVPREVAEALGGRAQLLLAIPEHKVPMPGRGGDSQCDVFALLRRPEGLVAAAIEAKVDEPFGDPVADWLARGGSNRRARLDAMATLLECAPPPGHLRYQLFHRTAAAIVEARRFGAVEAAMIVQSFSASGKGREDFDAFADHAGCGRGSDGTRCLADGLRLRLAWVRSQVPPQSLAG